MSNHEIVRPRTPEYLPRNPESYLASVFERALISEAMVAIQSVLQTKEAQEVTFLGLGVGSGAFEQSLHDLNDRISESDPMYRQLIESLGLSGDELRAFLGKLSQLRWKVTDREGPESQGHFQGVQTLECAKLDLLNDPFPPDVDVTLARGVLHHLYSDSLVRNSNLTPQSHQQAIDRMEAVLQGMAQNGVRFFVARDPVLSEGDPFEMVDVTVQSTHGREILQEYLRLEDSGRRRLVQFDYEPLSANRCRLPRIIRDDLLNYANFESRAQRIEQKEELHAYLSASALADLCTKNQWQLRGTPFDYQEEVRGHFAIDTKELLVFTIDFATPVGR